MIQLFIFMEHYKDILANQMQLSLFFKENALEDIG